jgi:hypothetical protein
MENKNFVNIFSLSIIIFTLFLFSLLAFDINKVYGHTEIKVGNYTIEAGWIEEPPLLNNLNEIVIGVSENDNPVRNAMKDLAININYGGLDKKLNFIPSEESAGQYLADIIPSQLGTYSINLKGTIGTQSINNDIQIEDIEDAAKLTFPLVSAEDSSNNIENIGKQIAPMMKDLSNQIDESTQQINTTEEILQQISEENNSIRSEIDKTNIISYIATGLGASAIILVLSFSEMKVKFRK